MAARVSIIVPTYNAAQYIASLLDSIAKQTFSDWELIIIDDGSTDETAACLALAPADGRRQFIQQANGGSAAARNRGLAAAQGEWVVFLDVDDGWHPDFLSEMVAALSAAPEAVAAFCGWQYADPSGQLLPQVVQLGPQEVSELEQGLLWRNSIMPSSLVTRRQAVARLGGFDETLKSCEDWDLWLRLIQLGRFIAVPRILTWYRAHPGSKTDQVARVERERLKVNAKHLGALDEPLAQWPPARRRAVGFTYFNTALGFLWQNDEASGRERIRRAVACWPGLLDLDEFYYELGCANQPRGLRGSPQGLDLRAGEALIREALFTSTAPASEHAARAHWGQACLVLARLARNTRQWPACRRYALRAVIAASNRGRLEATRLLARSVMPEALLAWLRRERPQPGAQPLPRP